MSRSKPHIWTKALRVLLVLAASSCSDGPTQVSDGPTHLEFTVQPSDNAAGVSMSPAIEVTVKDADGFRVFGANTQVTLQFASNPNGASLSGTVSVRAEGGIATFRDLAIDKVGSGYTLTASAPTAGNAMSGPFAIGPGSPSELVFTGNPSNVMAGEVITPPIEVTVLDAFGNLAADTALAVTLEISGAAPAAVAVVDDGEPAANSSDTTAVTAAASAVADAATLHGTTTVTAVDGVATFDNIWMDRAATDYSLTARAGDIASQASAPFITTSAAPVQLGFQTQPSDGTADQPIAPVQVAIQDEFGNLVTTATGAITVALGANPGGSTLSGTKTKNVVGGVATFDDLSLDVAAAGYRLLASAIGYGNTTSDAFTVIGGAAAQLRIKTQPSNATAFTAITPPIEIEILDGAGNLLTSANHAVTVAIGANPGGGSLSGTVTRNAINGVATFDDISIDMPATGYTLVASAAGLSSVTSVGFSVGEGTATQLQFRTQPGIAIAGSAIEPAIEVGIYDTSGHLITTANQAVTISLGANPTGGTLSGATTVSAVGGIATFDDLWIDKSGSGYRLTATSTGLSSTTSNLLTVAAAAAVRFFIVDPPDGTVPGPVRVTVRALDEYGNVATSENRDVTLVTSGSATGYGLVSIAGGIGNLLINDLVAETVILTLDDTQGTGLDVSTTQDLVFEGGPAFRYVILNPNDGVILTPITVTVQAEDRYGNVATDENRNVTLVVSGSATGAGVVDIQNGAGTRDITDAVPETVSLSLSDSEGTGLDVTSTQDVSFSSGTATRLVILDPVDGTVDAPILVSVNALDQYGNVATGEHRGVTLLASGSADAGFVNLSYGVGTLLINDQVAETVTLSLLDTELTGMDVSSTQDVTFATGAVNQFSILDPSDGMIQTPITVTVRAEDQYGNIVTTENRDVTLVTSGSATGGGLVNVQAGVGTRDISDAVPETVTLTLSDTEGTGLNVASTQDVVFSAGGATRYVILDPTDGTVDGPILVTVNALDQYGNVATGENRGVMLLATGSATEGFVSVYNGVGTILLYDQIAENITLTLLDTQGTGLDVSSTQSVLFAPGAPTRYAIVDPTDGMIQTPITVTVQAEDQYGNVVTSENRDVTLVTSGSATGAGLVDIQNGVGTRNINDAVPETVTLSLSDTEGTGLNVVSTQDVVFSSGTATRFVILNPTDGTVDGPILVTVQALDQFGNVATGESRGVTLVASGSVAGGFVNVVNGLGTRLIYNQVAETVNLSLLDTELTGLDVSSTQNVVFSAGASARFVIVDPIDGVIQTPIQVTVQAHDQYGNVVTTENRDVTLVTSGSATGGGLVNIQNGVGTRNINDAVPETVALTLSDTEGTGLNVTSTQDVIFSSGAATRFVILNPTDGTVDGPVLVTIQALDQFGNVATGENRGVTLVTSGSATGGFVDIFNGVGTELIYDQVAETVNLSLLDTGLTGLDVSSTQNVVFAPGVATRFTILDPTNGMVGTPVPVTVQAQDQYGNMVPSENRDVTLLASGSATGEGLVNIQNGSGTISISDDVPETVILTLSDTQGTGLNVASTQDVIFSSGTATRIVILNPVDGTVDNQILVTIHALDQYGNVATGENRGVTLLTSGSAVGGFVSFYEGVATEFIYDQVAETVQLSLSDTQGTGLDVSSTQDVVFAPGAVSRFWIDDPTDGTVGTPIPVTVRAQDQFGNQVTSENRDVTLVTSGSATGGGLVNIQSGQGTRNISNTVPETVNLSLSDTQGTGLNVSSTQDVIFGAGAATRFVILNPIDGTVDDYIQVTVQAQDQFGNVVTTEFRDVTLVTSGSAVGGGLLDVEYGVGTTYLYDPVAETVNLSLSDTQGTGLNVTSTQDVVFGVGAAVQFFIVNPPDGTVGTPVQVTVQARDQHGNVAANENRDVTLVTTGAATGGGLVNIQNGIGTLSINDLVPETVILTLSDTEVTGLDVSSYQDVNFAVGAATRFVILNPMDGTVDDLIQVIVQAQDQLGNVVTTESRDVTLLTSGSAVGGGLIDIQFGVGATYISDPVAETVNLSLSDTQGTGLNVTSTQDVVFGVGAAVQFFIVNPPDGTVGTPIQVTVQARDQHGNVATAENRDVTLVTTGSATGGGLVNIQNGTGTLSINDQVAETVILTLSDTEVTGLDVSSYQDVNFAVGAATRFVILDPIDGSVDTPIQVTVQAQDQLGNVVTTESRDVTLLTSGSAVGGGLLDIQFGVGTTYLSDPVPETVNLSLSDTQGTGLNVTSTQNVVFAIGAVAQFVVLNPPDGTVGTPIQVTVQARDQHGNLVTTENRDVTLVTTGSATGGGLVDIQNGTGSRSINDEVAETVILSLSDTEGTGLNVSSFQDVTFALGAATQFVILDPTDGTVDFWIPVTVQAQNQFGTVVTSENRDVTLVTSGSATGGGLVNIQNGVGTLNVSNTVPETVNLSLSDTQGTGLTVTSAQDVIFAVGSAAQYVILDPTDGTVNTLIPVTVQAQDQHGNPVTTVAGSVTLLTSGSATGGGTVAIAGGSGTINITDAVAETVTLGLANPVPGLFDGSTQDVVFLPELLLSFLNPALLGGLVR